jgi:hypothetical protein
MKIVASCTCPVGALAGHDADECRANLLEDESVLCVICGCTYPKMSAKMRDVWRAIVSSGFNVPQVQLGSSTERGSREYNAACLSGYDPAQSDMVRAQFRRGDSSVRLEYEQHNQSELDTADLSIGRSLTADELSFTPDHVRACVASLEALGFRVRHVGVEHEYRIVMTCGRPVGSMGYVIGASIQLSWRN